MNLALRGAPLKQIPFLKQIFAVEFDITYLVKNIYLISKYYYGCT